MDRAINGLQMTINAEIDTRATMDNALDAYINNVATTTNTLYNRKTELSAETANRVSAVNNELQTVKQL